MKKIALTVAAVAAFGLAACTDNGNEAANNTADYNTTENEAIDDVNASANDAGAATDNALDSVGNTLGNAASDVGNAAEDAVNAVDNNI
ncbi:MAG: hypothetical protein ACK40O_01865 [Allosphingosinicella sp.]